MKSLKVLLLKKAMMDGDAPFSNLSFFKFNEISFMIYPATMMYPSPASYVKLPARINNMKASTIP
jgi:hypothetical protein